MFWYGFGIGVITVMATLVLAGIFLHAAYGDRLCASKEKHEEEPELSESLCEVA